MIKHQAVSFQRVVVQSEGMVDVKVYSQRALQARLIAIHCGQWVLRGYMERDLIYDGALFQLLFEVGVYAR
jgi:hypothetical protein